MQQTLKFKMAHSYQQIRKVELKTCNLICYAEQTIENWLVETTISNTCRRCHIYPLHCDAYYLDLLMYVCRSANEHRTVGRQCLQGSNPLGVSFFCISQTCIEMYKMALPDPGLTFCEGTAESGGFGVKWEAHPPLLRTPTTWKVLGALVPIWLWGCDVSADS